MTGPQDIFISYSARDRESAEAVCTTHEAAGIRCWIAPSDVVPGTSYAALLVDAISQSRLVLLLFSQAANDSDAVLNELELAANRSIPVLPVRIERIEPQGAAEFYLRRRHWLDAFDDFNAALERIPPAVRSSIAERVTVRSPKAKVRQRNLPRQGTSFIGREAELRAITAMLAEHPLVTIVGPGGVGKTRIAVQAALDIEEPGDGVWFVDLAPLSAPELVAGTILTSLGAPASVDRSPLEHLIATIADRELILVMDNCEHLVAEASHVAAALIRACSHVTILATSREALNVRGEHVVRLNPLDPGTAVRLFCERAQSVNPLFERTPSNAATIETICARLDGLALAIELAAARVRVISIEELAKRLDERFRILTGGSRDALPHQQTLRALIDWSYDTLTENERALFRRTAAFAGTFALEALTEVAGFEPLDPWETLDLLASLVDKSLVTAEIDERGQRYHLLQSILDYADERLVQSDERSICAQRHAAFFGAFFHQAYEEWDTAPGPDWLSRVRAEIDNLRSALRRTLKLGDDRVVGAALAADAVPVFLRAQLLNEGVAWCEAALAQPDLDPTVVAQLHYGLSMLHNNRLSKGQAQEHVERAVALYRLAGPSRALVRALSQQAQQTARAGNRAAAIAPAAEAIDAARSSGDSRLLAATLQRCALVFAPEEIEQAREQFRESVALFRRLERPDETARALEWWSVAEGDAGAFDQAISLAREAVRCGAPEDRLHRQNIVASCALAIDDRDAAAPAARETLALSRAAQQPVLLAYAIAYLAAICRDDDPESAARLAGFADARLAALGVVPDITDTMRTERLEAALRMRLGQDRRDALRAEGALWDEPHALARAERI